ncbi:MAG TPA: glycosyltransferase family 2 protein [Gemmatimonadales bacterium]|jgi:chlorobactene glucosyltransferase
MMSLLLAAPWIAVLWIVVRRYASRGPQLHGYAPRPAGPTLSVIIPARNEAPNIERCVRSVLAAAYTPIEIIVVDDRSSDDTAGIVERLAAAPEAGGRVRLVRGEELPPGWFGKQWALVQGYRVAAGDLVLFADADTKHEPELIPRAVTALRTEHVDLVTILPRQEMETFWERLVQPHVFFALQARVGNLRHLNRTRTAWNAIANGQFILTTRVAYDAVGTHVAVRDSVADDVMLAQAYVRGGRDIFLVHAMEYMATRMYRSLSEIIGGWSKNLALGAPLMTPPIAILRRLIPYLTWLPVLAWIGPPLAWLVWRWDFTVIAMAASLGTWLEIYRREQAPWWYALLYPMGASMVAYIMLRSAWRGGRRVEWRGRLYKV